MKTKEDRIDEAWKKYHAIVDPAWEALLAKLREIDKLTVK